MPDDIDYDAYRNRLSCLPLRLKHHLLEAFYIVQGNVSTGLKWSEVSRIRYKFYHYKICGSQDRYISGARSWPFHSSWNEPNHI